MILAFEALEFSFTALLVAMTVGSGVVALVVVARIVEPRGVRALVRRLAGRPSPTRG